jgi:hypothetical protein
MAALHEHGLVWKDAHPGVWLASTELFGRKAFAYAIELYDRGNGVHWARTDDGSELLDGICDYVGPLTKPAKLGGMPVQFFVVSE